MAIILFNPWLFHGPISEKGSKCREGSGEWQTHGIGGTDQGSNPALLLTNYVAWGELYNLSDLACYLWNGNSITGSW